MNTVSNSNISLRRCFSWECKCLPLECDELQYYWMEQPHHFPLASDNTGWRLQDTWKNGLCALHAQAESSLECYPRVCLDMRVHNWVQQVKGAHAKDERGGKPQHKKRKCLRTYCSLVRTGSVCSPDMMSPTSVLWQAMRGEEQRSKWQGGRDVAQRSTAHKQGQKGQGSNKKSDTRTREKDQVSQAGAERLKFQESWKGNDWKRGEKIESDSQKENCH